MTLSNEKLDIRPKPESTESTSQDTTVYDGDRGGWYPPGESKEK